MSNAIITFVKTHPYGLAAGVLGVGILWLLFRGNSGSSTAVTVGSNPSDVAAATQLSIAQLQSQQASNQVNAQAAVAGQQIAGAVTIDAQNNATSVNNNTISADVAKYVAGLTAQTQQVISTLTAQVAIGNTAADVSKTQITADAYTKIATAPYTAQVQIAQINADAYNSASVNALNQIRAAIAGESTTNQGYEQDYRIAQTTVNNIGSLVNTQPQSGNPNTHFTGAGL